LEDKRFDRNKNNRKNMANYRANVENIANVVEYIRNVDPEQFANIRDDVFEVFEEMEVDFEEIMDQDSDEEVLSDDTDYTSDLSKNNTNCQEKFVLFPEICALNDRIKHCAIHCYYTMSGALTVCALCMTRLVDTNVGGMYRQEARDRLY